MVYSRKNTALVIALFGCLWLVLRSRNTNMKYDDRNILPVVQNNISIPENKSLATNETHQYLTIDPDVFEPEVSEDFQTVNSENPRIPHIKHSVFLTGKKDKHGIPSIYQNNVKSFLHFNPNWTYYFWSDASARELIAARHPALLSTYDNYKEVIFKADAIRYVVLYEFGGLYSDLDINCMRPLDRVTMKYACILTTEPFEHSAIIYKIPYIFSNALMMCRPKHPFFKQIIESLPNFAKSTNVLYATGPHFFTKQFILYNNIQQREIYRMKNSTESNSPNFYKGALKEDDDNATYVSNTQYFMSSYDSSANSFFQKQCALYSSRYSIVKRGCDLWRKRKKNIAPNPFSYTDHYWKHMYSIRNETEMIPIKSVIPQIKQYNDNYKRL